MSTHFYFVPTGRAQLEEPLLPQTRSGLGRDKHTFSGVIRWQPGHSSLHLIARELRGRANGAAPGEHAECDDPRFDHAFILHGYFQNLALLLQLL